MIAFGYYLLKVILCSGILYGYYLLALRNRVFHQWNRYYLLFTLVISMLLPLVRIPVQVDPVRARVQAVKVLDLVTTSDAFVEALGDTAPSYDIREYLLILAYSLVCLVFLSGLVKGLLAIRRLVVQHAVFPFDRFLLVDTAEEKAPFSFLHYIFWRREIPIDSETGQQILRHEIAHVREQHSIDKIFMQLILAIFWMNPFFWLIRKEMGMIHEFIADRQSVAEGDTAAFAAMILQSVYPGRSFGLSNPFFHSPIQRRLNMLLKARNTKVSYATRILALPLLGMLGIAFTVRTIRHDVQARSASQPLMKYQQSPGGPTGPDKQPKSAMQTAPEVEGKGEVVVSQFNAEPQGPEDTSILRMGKTTLTLSSSAPWDMPNMLIFINGKKTTTHAILQKKIEADSVIMYPKNNTEAIRKFGPEASQGVFLFYGATVTDAPPSSVEHAAVNIHGHIAPVQDTVSPGMMAYGTQPLYVIDGLVISRGAERDALNTLLKPEDIEKIDVLREKNGLAIYGEEGKNGVVIITTKKAKERGAFNGTASTDKAVLEVIDIEDNSPVFTKVDIPARFPGGQARMEAWLRDQLALQAAVQENPGSFKGKAGLRFIVNSLGQVTNVSLLNANNKVYNSKLGLMASALLQKGPYWEPARQNGNKVRSFVDIEFDY